MHYQFPIITHIDDVLPSIKNRDEFKVIEKDDYIVVNYMLQTNDTFPPIFIGDSDDEDYNAKMRRECRGLIFAKNGKLIRRSFHKFFNLNEKMECLEDNVDVSLPHVVLEKLDGSMVTPLPLETGMRWATKAGITDVSMQAEIFVAKNPKFSAFAKKAIGSNIIPIFEWCSPKNRIVIKHKEDQLILTGLRKQATGEYATYNQLKAIANYDGIPYVQETRRPKADAIDIEGVVLSFDSGHKLKVKTEWYVTIHRAKEEILNEKRVIAVILDDKLDDILPHLPEDDKKALEDFRNAFVEGLLKTASDIQACWFQNRKGTMVAAPTRKEFALNVAPGLPEFWAGIIFQSWDDVDQIWPALQAIVRRHCGSQTTIDRVRPLWGDAVWIGTQ